MVHNLIIKNAANLLSGELKRKLIEKQLFSYFTFMYIVLCIDNFSK